MTDGMDLLERFNGLKALVVGDVMIDTYTKGVIERMSPEAPVPIVNMSERFDRLGGAANVAVNLTALEAVPVVCSVIGDDVSGNRLFQLMQEHGLNTDGLVKSQRRKTTVKHRVFNGDKQVLRIDEEDTFDLNEEEHFALIHIIENQIDDADIVIFAVRIIRAPDS